MISKIVFVLRPACVAATISLAVLVYLLVGMADRKLGDLLEIFFSYLAFVIASTFICYIDDPKRLTGRQ